MAVARRPTRDALFCFAHRVSHNACALWGDQREGKRGKRGGALEMVEQACAQMREGCESDRCKLGELALAS